jgi:hypothetical protein
VAQGVTCAASAILKLPAFLGVAARNRDLSSIRVESVAPMQSPAELDLALRVLNTIRSHTIVKQRDALELRMWAAPHSRMQPLEDIANEIIDSANRSIKKPQEMHGMKPSDIRRADCSEGLFIENED